MFEYCSHFCTFYAGLTSRDFKGFPSLQEVECSGRSLGPEVKLLSLIMIRLADNKVIASLNVFSNTCVTLGDFSSCVVDTVNTHRSKLRILVFDLEEGESRKYGCKVHTVDSFGNPTTSTWTRFVQRNSKHAKKEILCSPVRVSFSCGNFLQAVTHIIICINLLYVLVLLMLSVLFIVFLPIWSVLR